MQERKQLSVYNELEHFEFNQQEEIKEYFKEHGFVVILNVLSNEEIEETINELWSSNNYLGGVSKIKREEAHTWSHWLSATSNGDEDEEDEEEEEDNNNNEKDEGESKNSGSGFLSSLNGYEDKMYWKNLQNPKVYQNYQLLLNKREIESASSGRYGMMRPTFIPSKNDPNKLIEKKKWRTRENWLHWDQNPWRTPDFERVQGMITLSEHTITSGGFCCVPKFQKKFKDWSILNPLPNYLQRTSNDEISQSQIDIVYNYHLIYVPSEDDIQKEVVAITMPKGSLLIWDSRLPHQNYPNNDQYFRIVQYITFNPVNYQLPDHFNSDEEKQSKLLELFRSNERFIDCNDKVETGLIPSSFIDQLTNEGLWAVGILPWDLKITPHLLNTNLSENDQEALKLYYSAQVLEMNGKFKESALAFRRAFKLNPRLERASRTL